MRAVIGLSTILMISGCAAVQDNDYESCHKASHAVRVHDSKIEVARNHAGGSFTAQLPSKGHATYTCSQRGAGHLVCVQRASGSAAAAPVTPSAKLMRERHALVERADAACRNL